MLSARPKAAELVYQVFGRPLHPELFDRVSVRNVNRAEYDARVAVTSTGHIVEFVHQGLTLTEVATTGSNDLGVRRRLITHKLKGNGNDFVQVRGGCSFKVDFSLETVSWELFWAFHQELAAQTTPTGMLHAFASSGRINLGAISYINIEARSRSLLVQAFHTFPEDQAILKTQALYQIPANPAP